MDVGLGRFSPDTRRGEDEASGAALREGVEGIGSCDLKGDLETRLLLRRWR